MTKLAIVITGALFSGAFVAGAARAADKAPAAAAAPTAAAGPAAAKAPAAAPAAAAPAAATPPAAPTPSPEVDALYKGWVGSYKCDTTFVAGSMGPGSPEMKAKSEVKIAKDLGGFWYKGDYKLKKSKTMPMAMEAVFLLGYDAVAKEPINLNYDSMGTFAMEHAAAGATADKITFVGDGQMMGMKIKIREGMTKKDDKTVEHTFEVDMGKGFQAMGTDICKK
ncbi:MAG TPA: DUF1579 family protein [Polyangia bacterium]|nr:DUF1579 family protein [Polyangia bacterium]